LSVGLWRYRSGRAVVFFVFVVLLVEVDSDYFQHSCKRACSINARAHCCYISGQDALTRIAHLLQLLQRDNNHRLVAIGYTNHPLACGNKDTVSSLVLKFRAARLSSGCVWGCSGRRVFFDSYRNTHSPWLFMALYIASGARSSSPGHTTAPDST
jgi:hypothetical protein